MSLTSDFWTPDKFDTLRNFWVSSRTPASQIAVVLGCTKNAVIGKVHRCRLLPRPETDAERFWTPDRLFMLEALWFTPWMTRSDIAVSLGCTKSQVIIAARKNKLGNRPKREPEPATDSGIEVSSPAPPLFFVGANDCRFPIGNPGNPDFHFCRVRVETEGRSYCDEHHRIAFRPMKSEVQG